MMLRVAGGTLLGAMVLMLWGYLYWDLILPPGTAIRDAREQPALAEALRTLLPGAGTYFIPHEAPGSGETHQSLVAKLDGAIAMIHFAPQGGDPLSPVTYTLSFVHFLLTTLLASLLLAMALPALPTYGKRAGFLCGMALFAIFTVRLTDPIWYRLPFPYFLYVSLFLAVGWLGASLVIAAVVRPLRKTQP